MARLKSSKKRAKQNIGRRQKNLTRKTAIKTAIKKVVAALETGLSAQEMQTLLRDAEAKLSRAKSKGVLHANTVERKISNLAKKVAAATR
ncbi:MAG: 30S ribosomal protein S20 [Candidatus Babeliales bacterium]